MSQPGRPRGPFLFDGSPALVGHRGAGKGVSPAGHRENTAASMLEAVAHGATWIETDALATLDGGLPLRHHTGPGPLLTGQTLAQVLAADPDLDTLVAAHAILPRHVGLDVEIKVDLPAPDGTIPGTDPVLDWVAAHAHERPWLITSFDPLVIPAARARGLHAGWLTNARWPLNEALVAAVRLGATVIAVEASTLVDPSPGHPDLSATLDAVYDHGLQILVWNVEPADAPALAAAGVAALCTNDIPGTRTALTALTDQAA